MKRISIYICLFLTSPSFIMQSRIWGDVFCSPCYADRTIFQYRDRGIEITVKLVDPNNGEPGSGEPGSGEPVEPVEPVEPNEPPIIEPNEPNEPPDGGPTAGELRWVSPVSVEDPNEGWSGETKIIDGDPNTYAVAVKKLQPLILNLAAPADSNACRLFMRSASRFWRVDIFYEGDWHSVYDGGIVPGRLEIFYQRKPVSSARIFQTGGSANGSISEFEFFAAVFAAADTNEPPDGGPPVTEPNEPIEISSNIKNLKTMGDFYGHYDLVGQSQKQSMITWWSARYEKGWEAGNSPPWYILKELEEKYGEKFWEN